jgi:hypothetical protein
LEQFPAQENIVRPPEEPTTTLVKRKPARRSISARDFSLPKPYRKPRAADARGGMSHRRMAIVALSGLLSVGLVAALALIAHDNATSPHPLTVVAVKQDAPPARATRSAPAVARPSVGPDPAFAHQPGLAHQATATVPAPSHSRAALALTPADVPADPDVELIAAILMLTPAAPATPACGDPPAPSCTAVLSPDP